MSDSDSYSRRERQKRPHPHVQSAVNREIASDPKKNRSEKNNMQFQQPRRLSSRLQILQDHNIIENVLIFLDETALFELENTHSEMIGRRPFARQWFFLSTCDEQRTNFSLCRWRPLNEDDVKSVNDGMESSMTMENCRTMDDNDNENRGNDSERRHDPSLIDMPPKKELLARRIGRDFAEEQIFVEEREKEASQIYMFDRAPENDIDIPISIGDSSLDDLSDSSPHSLSSLLNSKNEEQHWNEWFDYRMHSVNNRDAFVRLSLRDGSGRFWHGFRRLSTGHSRTFFSIRFDMKELIRDMRWTELEACSECQDTSYTSFQRKFRAMESLMRTTQLTVSLGRKLLMATGGCSLHSVAVRAATGACFFHNRNYRFPLSHSTENDLQWKPYRSRLAYDSVQNELVVRFDCDHTDLPFMRVEDIGNPKAHAHW
mmetsp:Transcript_11441/g.32932  ORF Transcript_11441/g.32932 Transcript_11441/m.32932 type:complete len:429 (+) Transcript_11441:251-1537(+)